MGSLLLPAVAFYQNMDATGRPCKKIAIARPFRSGFYSDICGHENTGKPQDLPVMKPEIRLLLVSFLLLVFVSNVKGQLSSRAQISVITCGPGADLYATFGHSAFRVQDPVNGLDVVYNYGTFNFNTPNFYLKFARGKLLYSLSREPFEDFLYTYQLEKRWVKEQILQLSSPERNELFRFLETNYEPANRDYKYDFLFNNCSTKIPDVLSRVLGDRLSFDENYLEEQFTFRQLIQQYLETNSWSSLGIDLALGAVIDRKAKPLEHMFLPDYVYAQLNHSLLGGKPLVLRERTILQDQGPANGAYFTLTPAFWLALLLLFTITITYIDYKNGSRSQALDFLMLFITGTTGLVIIFLWFFTDHTATVWNFNLLWAFPLNLFLAFYLLRRGSGTRRIPVFMVALLTLLALVPVLWITGIQLFSPLLIAIWCSLALRYLFLYRHYKFLKAP